MKLLIITQTVDQNDTDLAFFLGWIRTFALHCEHIEVICLKEGEYALPANVQVHSLGKEKKRSRLAYLFNFYTYLVQLRGSYDAVFVHMNPEYVILGGLFWRLSGTRIALWYTHKSVTLKLRIAAALAHIIFTASRESFRLPSKKVRVMGHGIDTNFFSPDDALMRAAWILSAGRLSKSKRHDLAVRAAALAHREIRVVGDGPERDALAALARGIGASAVFTGGLPPEGVRDAYRRAGMFVHTSETGSLDKMVLEALACGLRVITTSTALSGLPIERVAPTPEAIAEALAKMPAADAATRVRYVQEYHSLERLIPALVAGMTTA